MIRYYKLIKSAFLACLHDQNKRGFFGGPAFLPPKKPASTFGNNLVFSF